MAARLQIPYGIADFKRIRDEGYYYVDKTAYIRKMEARGTTLHQIVFQFRGAALHRLEQVAEEAL